MGTYRIERREAWEEPEHYDVEFDTLADAIVWVANEEDYRLHRLTFERGDEQVIVEVRMDDGHLLWTYFIEREYYKDFRSIRALLEKYDARFSPERYNTAYNAGALGCSGELASYTRAMRAFLTDVRRVLT